MTDDARWPTPGSAARIVWLAITYPLYVLFGGILLLGMIACSLPIWYRQARCARIGHVPDPEIAWICARCGDAVRGNDWRVG